MISPSRQISKTSGIRRTADDADYSDKKMRIHVHFYAQLRDLAGIPELDVDLREGATVAELLEKIYAVKPALREHDQSILVGAGVEFVERDHALSDGYEIAVMPPVQGG
jgi:molybdopterin converting factor small subunit